MMAARGWDIKRNKQTTKLQCLWVDCSALNVMVTCFHLCSLQGNEGKNRGRQRVGMGLSLQIQEWATWHFSTCATAEAVSGASVL